ncbi:MAG TPA: FIST N-terminal domain-containing protein [Gemmatimonadaceae bacterium]|nr:FIST N-terminal domain-containing protein [Gemmatimonadaceae bacterium]
MPIAIAQSRQTDPRAAAAEIAKTLAPRAGSLVVYFASASYPQEQLAAVLHKALAPARTLGCSTAGEIVSGALSTGTVVAMHLSADDVSSVDVQLIGDIKDDRALDRALEAFGKHFGAPIRQLDPTKYVGLVLMDGMSLGEERFLDRLGDRTDMFFVGGSAGDDLAFKQTWVHADGRVSGKGAVLAVMKPKRGFEVIKTQSFCDSGRRMVATAVDEASRRVLEFDGRPAVEAYAAAIGATPATLAEEFGAHPIGLMVDDEPYVRSPARIAEDGVAFFCGVKEGTELAVLDATDIVADTKRLIAERAKGASGLLVFNCILRTLELQRRGTADAFGKLFSSIPTVGFSTYGETYIGHLNQTATMLLLK